MHQMLTQFFFQAEDGIRDFPSEFVVIADRDSTLVTITPSANIRLESLPHTGDTVLAHASGTPFTVLMQRGDAVQFETTLALNLTNYDLTGTKVHASAPVGVIAGTSGGDYLKKFTGTPH